MTNDSQPVPQSGDSAERETVEMPAPTVAPMMLSLGLILMAAGTVLGLAFLLVGSLLLVVGMCTWVAALLPGRGHFDEPLAEPAMRPGPVTVELDMVEQLRPGMPGYRFRLPEQVHPISAGIKGGVLGGILMTVPALAYGVLSGHGIWFPINLLAGIVLPGVDKMSVAELEQFRASLLLVGIVIHAAFSVVFGLSYGVLLPTLPAVRAPLWGGLLLPLLWTGASYGLMGVANPALQMRVDWFWFIVSQFVFGMVTAVVVIRSEKIRVPPAGSGRTA